MTQLSSALGSSLTNKGSFPVWLLIIACITGVHLLSPSMSGMQDPDFYWHLLYARWMNEHGAIPTVDFISWPFDGAPYVLTQWLGQWLVGTAFFSFGANGTSVLALTCVLITVGLAWKTARQESTHSTLAFFLAVACTTTFWGTYARPQVFSFVCMAAAVAIMQSALRAGWTFKRSIGYAFVMVLWVNLHGSYVVGLVYFAVQMSAVLVDTTFKKDCHIHLKTDLRQWAPSALLVTTATLINPNGWKAWSYVVEIAGLQSTTSGIIMEWAPTSFGTAVGSTYILLLIGTLLILAITKQRPSTHDLVVVAAMGIFGLVASRQAYYSTLAVVPVVARYGSRTGLAELAASQMRTTLSPWIATAAIVGSVLIGVYANTIRAKGAEHWQKKVFPVEASRFIVENKLSGKVFNESSSGGYLAYATGMKVFVDGRMDLYKDTHFFEWFYTRMGTPIWEEQIGSMRPDIFVLQHQSALTQLLLQRNEYALVHADATYAVIVRRQERFSDLISASNAQRPRFRIFDAKGNLVATPMGY